MIIYGFDPKTGEFRGKKEARPDPLEHHMAVTAATVAAMAAAKTEKKPFDPASVTIPSPTKFLVPKGFTTTQPPPTKPGQVAVFAGGTWTIKTVAAPPEPEQHKPTVDDARGERNGRLADSDWTQLPDAPISDAARKAWASYRQALRDLPGTISDPSSITWPVKPT